jgi:hypothetical protein
MNITNEQRIRLLKSHNDLRSMLMTIHDCQDIWLSDVGKLEQLECLLHSVFKFVPREDDEGKRQPYCDWVLEELDEDED